MDFDINFGNESSESEDHPSKDFVQLSPWKLPQQSCTGLIRIATSMVIRNF